MASAAYLRQCIYSVGLGNNDYLNNYFMPQMYSTSRQYTPVQYADVLLIQQFFSTTKGGLRQLRATKVALIGVGQIGCSPNTLANSPDGRTCVERINSACRLFNDRLRNMVDNLNNNLDDAQFIYVNAYGIFDNIIRNPASNGKSLNDMLTQ
ncbi:hypothetical protein IFM89_010542 [Coptis chinensis]|uniref:GDSL esterase/lipase n=1 Tax=Coptis chinensis TaxID=261450 RepID=A0A835IV37_9MAGN|nr:hypothetical protein IFM89_010542 [Coptis chinensis]